MRCEERELVLERRDVKRYSNMKVGHRGGHGANLVKKYIVTVNRRSSMTVK
jgi:hypothetical protein